MTLRTEALAREIADSRDRLGRTLEIIRDRMSGVLYAAGRHPVPILLIGAGAGWLLHNLRSARHARSPGRIARRAERIPVLNRGQARVYDPDVASRHPMHDLLESRREMSARV